MQEARRTSPLRRSFSFCNPSISASSAARCRVRNIALDQASQSEGGREEDNFASAKFDCLMINIRKVQCIESRVDAEKAFSNA